MRSVVITAARSVVITPAIVSEQVGRLQQSIALLPKNCLEQSPDRSTSDAPITRPPTLRDFSLLRCLGTGGYAEVCLAPYISLYLPISPYISACSMVRSIGWASSSITGVSTPGSDVVTRAVKVDCRAP